MGIGWLITWTTYGSWLPGDPRGFVSAVRDADGHRVIHNVYGTEYDRNVPKLARFAVRRLRGRPIRLTQPQAEIVLHQMHQTIAYRGWQLHAAAVMATHVHVVVEVAGDPDPAGILKSLKGYASRALNQKWQQPANGTWWTESGSRRVLKSSDAIIAAAEYVRDQEFPLARWVAPCYLPSHAV